MVIIWNNNNMIITWSCGFTGFFKAPSLSAVKGSLLVGFHLLEVGFFSLYRKRWLLLKSILLQVVFWTVVGITWNKMEFDQGRHHWTRTENRELVFCYYTSHANVHGFRKRLYSIKYLDCGNPRKFLWFQLLLVYLALFLLISPVIWSHSICHSIWLQYFKELYCLEHLQF